MMIALACIYMKMSPEEAVTALTINGAAAVGRPPRLEVSAWENVRT